MESRSAGRELGEAVERCHWEVPDLANVNVFFSEVGDGESGSAPKPKHTAAVAAQAESVRDMRTSPSGCDLVGQSCYAGTAGASPDESREQPSFASL